jgi:hypothetical protein
MGQSGARLGARHSVRGEPKTYVITLDTDGEIQVDDHHGERQDGPTSPARARNGEGHAWAWPFNIKGRPVYAALTAMVFADFCASTLFGRVMVSRPLEKDASILDSSTS